MCGICGIVNIDRRQHVGRSTLEVMNRQMLHRGPDDDGFYVSANVGLAMRRLSVIDLQNGQQPVSNEQKTVFLVFNGEIYNHRELRSHLEQLGHRYRSRSDTETIVHLYEEYGTDCVQHLRGMFAFALWDVCKRRLFAARDRLGIKPFYYYRTPTCFLFGSEIKAILAHPGVTAELNRDSLPEYLAFGYLSGAETLFEGVRKLPPGHKLELKEDGELRIEQYWDLPLAGGAERSPQSDFAMTYRELLEEAVSSHLLSDVPLGVFLSGGIDSSVVAALASKIRRAPVETFSVGFAEAPYNELPYARTVATHLRSEHHEILVSKNQFFEALPRVIWHEDEPIVWPSSVALYFLARLAREHVTVVLTGEGSDETLAGYTRYAWTLWNMRLHRLYRALTSAKLRDAVRNGVARSRWLSADVQRKLQHTFLGCDGGSWISIYFDNFYSAFAGVEHLDLLSDELQSAPGAAYSNLLRYWEHSSGATLYRLLYTDIKTYLVELLMKQDNVSMAASIESRVPFLDHKLVEFAAGIPARLHTRGLAGKVVLKTAARDLLPASILHRRKAGFPTPWQYWVAGASLDSIENLLLEPRTIERGLFKQEKLRQLFAAQRARQADHSNRIWRLLNLELWQRVFLDRERPLSMMQSSEAALDATVSVGAR